MKVIAKVSEDTYICEIKHQELEKFLNLYYGKMKRLTINEEVNLGLGHDFLRDTQDALQKTKEFIEGNKKIVDTIMRGFIILGSEDKE